MATENHCKVSSKRCKDLAVSQAAPRAVGEALAREVHGRAIAAFRQEHPTKTAAHLMDALGVSERSAYHLLSGAALLDLGQVGILGRYCGGSFARRVLAPVIGARSGKAA